MTMRTVFFLTVILLLVQMPSRPGLAWGSLLHEDAPPPAASQDLVITSDSQAYCAQLSNHLAEKMRLPHDVPVGAMEDAQHLQEQGRELCQQNHIRAGIGRLRRALVLLKHQEEPHQ
ncbi:hypothetical protein NQF87_04065 [Bombella sp. TMW 2.2559]|uniref:Uncharacterized protein n=1 Tax=Bombella dulcis TaxID=2967339 RepID=A0ABT3WAN7_9PROT|nr:hypothetical protein [Bombella dulcis]MCX5616150.1 hypothetical protein [Bombella dulcis]